MIKESEVLQLLIDSYPQSRELFVEYADEWIPQPGGNGAIPSHAILRILSGFVVRNFIRGDYEGAAELFELIEKFVTDGDSNLANAACTCFIENLQNIASQGGEFEYSHFVPLLGINSKEYAKSWDKFTGINTIGI